MNREDFQDILKKYPFSVLKDVVYDFLLKDIITMKQPPGQKISEAQIANELGISRSPVKMAIDKLIEERLIIKYENKVLRVAPVDPGDYLKIRQARTAIEGSSGFLAAKNITPQELIELKKLTDEYKLIIADPTLKNFEIIDHKYHTVIVNASHNPYLIEMYNCIQNRILRYRYFIRHRFGEKSLHAVLQNDPKIHYAIFSAIKDGYSASAKSELELHIDGMREFFIL
jgi:DNA-binding GntR family transcriptional regulator